jgi:uncharacterized membrane protein YjdF
VSRAGAFLPTAVIASVAVLVVAVFAKVPTYRVAPAFLLPTLWAPVLLRRRLRLHPLHYALFAAAVLLHCMGAFGYYQRRVFGLSFDIYVHFYFAFAGTFLLERLVSRTLPVGPWTARAMTLLFMMGFGAIHELGEYVSYLVLGEERGMLKPSTSYFFDTQRDLLNNLLGTLTALLLIALARAVRGSDRTRNPTGDLPG